MRESFPTIGVLRHRLVLENLDEVPDASLALVRRFIPLAAFWADLSVQTGSAYHLGQQVGAGAVIATARSSQVLLTADRLDRWLFWPATGRRFRVTEVRHRDSQGRFIDLHAIEENRQLPSSVPLPGDEDDNPPSSIE